MLEKVLGNPIAVLFSIIALGYALGNVKVFGISLGSSAVLFVGLVFGHFGLSVPEQFSSLGVILFVYAIGLRAGPRFFATFQRRGIVFAQIAFAVTLSAAGITWLMACCLEIPANLAVGVFAGALTSTPGLAAATETLDQSVAIGYGIAYPFGVVGVVLFAQILSRIARKGSPTADASSSWGTRSAKSGIEIKQFRVANPQCDNKTLADLRIHGMTTANISRVKHEETITTAKPSTVLHVGDVVHAVGAPKELAKLEWIIGPETQVEMHSTEHVVARDVFVSEHRAAGKTIGELQVSKQFGVVIARVSREDIEFVPTGSFRLEMGDLLRIVGSPEDCESFIRFVGQHEKRIHETTILPFSIGIVLGVVLGYVPISLPGGITARLGPAGGPLLVGLLLGYFGGFGRLRLRTPSAVRYLLRELGLVFFLAGAGTSAGAECLEVFKQQGILLVMAGIVVMLVPMVLAYLLARFYFRLDLSNSLGSICGGMTSTPGLGAVCTSLDSDEPALAYATVYPIALISVTIMAQILALVLRT